MPKIQNVLSLVCTVSVPFEQFSPVSLASYVQQFFMFLFKLESNSFIFAVRRTFATDLTQTCSSWGLWSYFLNILNALTNPSSSSGG